MFKVNNKHNKTLSISLENLKRSKSLPGVFINNFDGVSTVYFDQKIAI